MHGCESFPGRRNAHALFIGRDGYPHAGECIGHLHLAAQAGILLAVRQLAEQVLLVGLTPREFREPLRIDVHMTGRARTNAPAERGHAAFPPPPVSSPRKVPITLRPPRASTLCSTPSRSTTFNSGMCCASSDSGQEAS